MSSIKKYVRKRPFSRAPAAPIDTGLDSGGLQEILEIERRHDPNVGLASDVDERRFTHSAGNAGKVEQAAKTIRESKPPLEYQYETQKALRKALERARKRKKPKR